MSNASCRAKLGVFSARVVFASALVVGLGLAPAPVSAQSVELPQIVVSAGQAPMEETVSIHGPDIDEEPPHLTTFFDAVRTRKPVTEDIVFGHNAALACHMANESYFRRSGVTWDAATKTIRG